MGLVAAALQLTRVSLALGGWMSILSLVLFILLTYWFHAPDSRHGRCTEVVLLRPVHGIRP